MKVTKRSKKKTKILIKKDIPIAEMVKLYPNVVDMLVTEWGFHCVSCYISNFETLEEGARTHGIVGDDFKVMLKMSNEIANLKIKDVK